MLGLLADENCEGHLEALVRICRSERWREVWESVHVQVYTFADLGINRGTSDAALWEMCQQRQLLLVTGNRNESDPESLGATIRARNAPDSLPVLTFADRDRIIRVSSYAELAAIRLMEILLDVDVERGTGRLFLPPKSESEGAQ
jgi:hypothetical protein